MKTSHFVLLPILAVAAACGGSGSADTTPVATSSGAQAPALPADRQIAALVYDSSYSVPDGFYVDERSATDRSYTIHHVLDESGSYELCSDDYAEALAWEAADNAARSVQGYFVTSHDNERYFEFVRELSYDNDVGNIEDLTSPGFARIFKCSNTNRNGVDRSLLSGYAGTLNAHPLDADTVRVFAEYLWQFTFFPSSRKKVIDSYGSSTPDRLEQTLVLAFSTSGGPGQCDRIEVARWTFSADPASGEVAKRFVTSHYFDARNDAGSISVCD